MHRIRRVARVAVLVPLLALLLACSIGGGPTADPAKVLSQAGPALGQVKTASVEMQFGSGATFFGFTVVSASGKVKLPADSLVTIKALQSSDSLIEIAVTTLGGQTWVTVPFLGVQEVTGAEAAAVPSVGRIFDPSKGLPGVLAEGRNPKLLGSETVDGVDCWKVEATYTAAQVSQAVQPLSPSGDIDATLWIGKSDHLLRKTLLKGKLFTASKTTTLQVRLYDFNAPVTITKPV
ncbi:MAG TPA: LppX_LprAFG lipoprotein [Candidatus Dormibacteraeota bacterium]|nr:LppX_LprAFG lipoprotein [Candidatus Dormibacteraeota bacterium]